MTLPSIGTHAPGFTLPNQDGTLIKLADLLGQFVVIYFYPKALTSGCTVQACAIRDNWEQLQRSGTHVIGISPDSPKLLKKFKDTENLPFDLLSDSEHKVAEAYGTWQQKSMYGRTYMGMARDTFILDQKGTIISVLRKVSPATHIHDVMTVISQHIATNK